MQSTDTTSTGDRFAYVTANDVYASLADGGSVSIREYLDGDAGAAATFAERCANLDGGDASLVLSLAHDQVGGAPIDDVWFHSDQSDRLRIIRRALAALENAEAALLRVGYVDDPLKRPKSA